MPELPKYILFGELNEELASDVIFTIQESISKADKTI